MRRALAWSLFAILCAACRTQGDEGHESEHGGHDDEHAGPRGERGRAVIELTA